jgi:hypothetical protein
LKRLTDITLYAEPSDTGSELFRLALAGNDLCQVNTIDDVRRIVRWLAPSEHYDHCYIKAVYSDGGCEVIPPEVMISIRRPFAFAWDTDDCVSSA